MLTIVTRIVSDPESIFDLGEIWSRTEIACSRSWHEIVSVPDFVGNEWLEGHELRWQVHDRDADRERPSVAERMKSWKHLLITSSRSMLTIVTRDREHPRLKRWRMQLGHGLKVLDHDRDCRSWAPQNVHNEWTVYLHELEAPAHDRDMDRERPRNDTIDIFGSRYFRSRSWWLCPGRDASYHDRDDGSWQVKLNYFLTFSWSWSLHLMMDILALIKPEIHLMEILV